jgi:hypothetical protein
MTTPPILVCLQVARIEIEDIGGDLQYYVRDLATDSLLCWDGRPPDHRERHIACFGSPGDAECWAHDMGVPLETNDKSRDTRARKAAA